MTEMERCVPKKVGKELAQHGTIQNLVSSAGQTTKNRLLAEEKLVSKRVLSHPLDFWTVRTCCTVMQITD